METLGYNKNRLLLGAAAAFCCGIVFLWVISSPEPFRLRGAARLLNTDFGRYVFAPTLMLACFACAWRLASTALGHGKAIELRDGDLIVHTIWGAKRFRPAEISSVTLQKVTGQTHLIVRGGKGALFGEKKAGLVLGLTEIDPARADALAAAIKRLRSAPHSAAPRRAEPEVVPDEPGFDADQALARYLARKEATGVSADPAQFAPQPRPVFGRKRV